jgi:ribosome-binding ATPase YchF (GTP1/OBG family)
MVTAAATLRAFRDEILFADLEIATNRIGKLEDSLKKPRPAKQKEMEQAELTLLQRVREALESGKPASALGLKEEEEKSLRSFQLLTLKPEAVFVNQGDDAIGKPLPPDLLAAAPDTFAAPAKLELELQELSADDRAAFMKDLGLTGSNRDRILHSIFDAMGQMVFFTVGEDE